MYLTRFIADTGIGGEYSALNLAIDELIPARYRVIAPGAMVAAGIAEIMLGIATQGALTTLTGSLTGYTRLPAIPASLQGPRAAPRR